MKYEVRSKSLWLFLSMKYEVRAGTAWLLLHTSYFLLKRALGSYFLLLTYFKILILKFKSECCYDLVAFVGDGG